MCVQVMPADYPMLTRALNDSDSNVIVSLLNKTEASFILSYLLFLGCGIMEAKQGGIGVIKRFQPMI